MTDSIIQSDLIVWKWMYFDRFAKVWCPYIDFQLIFCPPFAFRRIHFSLRCKWGFIYFHFLVFARLDLMLGCSDPPVVVSFLCMLNKHTWTHIEIVWRCYSFLSIRCHICNSFAAFICFVLLLFIYIIVFFFIYWYSDFSWV